MMPKDTEDRLVQEKRRKRVNHIKVVIILTICILTILPTIFCVILACELFEVQNQLDTILESDIYNEMILNAEEGSETTYKTEVENQTDQTELGQTVEGQTNSDIQTDVGLQEDTGLQTDLGIETNSNEQTNTSIGTNLGQQTASSFQPDVNLQLDGSLQADANSQKDSGQQLDLIPPNVMEPVADSVEKIDPLPGEINTKEEDTTAQTGEYKDKQVYLTFDDGPSKFTDTILDILNDYNVKATFFVTGHENEEAKRLYRRIVDEGHTLALHSYSHQYSEIYNSLEDFDKDFTKLWDLLYDTTGYKCTFYRFPGGSANKVSKVDIKEIIQYLNEKNITYFDWNVVNGDATGVTYTPEELTANVLNDVAKRKVSVVLMHDLETKENTVISLTAILEELTAKSAQILPIDASTPLVQQMKAVTNE